MKRLSLLLLSVLLLAGNLLAQRATIDDTAKFLAGMPVTGPLEPLDARCGLARSRPQHGRRVVQERSTPDPADPRLDARQRPEHYMSTNTMYYMFGGPDFLYANLFFPQAKTYILAGLEPVGQVPDITAMDPAALRTDFNALRGSMHTVLQTHYFITKDMRAELARPNLGGTLPILYVFLARLNCTILDTTYVNSPAPGVKITFTRDGGPQTLYYFKTDLSGGKSAFLKWCAAQGPGNSLLKAASYLMHTGGFTGVRDFLLENSRIIVQDDSGIPLKAFPKSWAVDCYGRFVPACRDVREVRSA